MLKVKVGSFTTGTGTGTIAVTDVGFQPDAILFWGAGNNAPGYGCAISTSSRWAVGCSNDSAYSTASGCWLAMNSTTGGPDGILDLQSMDSGGFTLAIDNQFGTSRTVYYLALKKSGASFACGYITEPGATGNQETSSLSFQPTLLLFAGGSNTALDSTQNNGGQCMLGVAVGASQQACSIANNGEVGSDEPTGDNYCYANGAFNTSSVCLYGGSFAFPTSPINATGALVSMDNDGFTINWTARAATRYYFYFATNLPGVAFSTVATRTDTTPFSETDSGHRPVVMLIGGQTASAGHGHSFGAVSGASARGCVGVDYAGYASAGGATPPWAANAATDAAIYYDYGFWAGLVGLMDLTSFDLTGWSGVMDDADTSAMTLWYVTICLGAVGGQLITMI